jgi:hypothetical protein
MAPCRLAKARQCLQRAVSHQHCQGGALVAMVGCPRHPCMRRVWGHGSRPLRRMAFAHLVSCGAEQRFDQRAERQPPHGIHGLFPAPLVTETADPRIVIGLEGCGHTGLSSASAIGMWTFIQSVLLSGMPTPSSMPHGSAVYQQRCVPLPALRHHTAYGRHPAPLLPRPQCRACPAASMPERCGAPSDSPSRPVQRRTRQPCNPLSEEKAIRS